MRVLIYFLEGGFSRVTDRSMTLEKAYIYERTYVMKELKFAYCDKDIFKLKGKEETLLPER
ncbi:hypothetical protein GCM10027566_39240 [Arachidicoccus ginsenosidivorans]